MHRQFGILLHGDGLALVCKAANNDGLSSRGMTKHRDGDDYPLSFVVADISQLKWDQTLGLYM